MGSSDSPEQPNVELETEIHYEQVHSRASHLHTMSSGQIDDL